MSLSKANFIRRAFCFILVFWVSSQQSSAMELMCLGS